MLNRALFSALLVAGFALASAPNAEAGLLARMMGHHGCCDSCCEPACCEPSCCEPAYCEPACCEPAGCDPCCEPACCEPAGCCDSCCNDCCGRKKLRLRDLFGIFCRKCKSCCEPACCEPACCEPACCCN